MMKLVSRYVLSAASLIFVLPGATTAQVEGRLYLDKTNYLVGEPIFLNFELANKGSEPIVFVRREQLLVVRRVRD